ncbi:MAG: ABC transporter ATP-binding protein, partial [bacterium]
MNQNSNSNKSGKRSLSTVGYVFKTIIWPRRYLLLLGLVLIIINRLAGLVLPGSSKYLIDDVIAKGDTALLKLLLFAVGGAVFMQASTSFFLTRLLSVEAQHLISLLRVKVQKHIIHLPVRYFDNTKSGVLVSRIMSDVEGVRNLVGTGLVQLFGGILTSVVALFLLLKINALMTLYTLVPLIFFGLISLKAFSYIRPIFRERGAINAEVTGRLTESLNGIRVIKGFNAEQQEIKVFENGVNRIFQNVKKSLTSTSLVTSSATLLVGLASVGIMGLGGTMIMKGNMTVGDFFAFTLYLGFLIAPIVQMSNIGSQITEAFAGLDRMEEILNMAKEGDDPARNVTLNNFKGNFSFENVTFAYEKGNDVLKDISFKAAAGTVTALVGSSGSGKTTIAGLAASFQSPNQGVVRIDGQDLTKVTLDSYRSQLGVVLQDDFLYEGTIRENILFGNPEATEAQLLKAVKATHVKEFSDRFEDGL